MGIIEYMLILVMTVALVMALSKGVGKPLQAYIKQNVIEVVGCMLRVGQFPAQSFGLCQAAVTAKFDFKGSVPSSSSDSAGPDGSSAKDDTDSKDSASSGADGSSGGGDTSASKKTKFRPAGSTGSIDESDSGGFDESTTKVVKIKNTELGANVNNAYQLQSSDGQIVIIRKIKRSDRVGGSFFLSEDEMQKEAEEKADSITKSKPVPVALLEERVSGTSFAIAKEKRRRVQGELTDTDVEFSFLGMIKWAIIIAIFVIFGLFTLSQLNSIRKGWTD